MHSHLARLISLFTLSALALLLLPGPTLASSPAAPTGPNAWIGPSAIAASHNGQLLYIAAQDSSEVLVFDIPAEKIVSRIPVTSPPSGLVLSPDDSKLFVTCASPSSTVCIIDTKSGKPASRLQGGYQAQSPILSPDGRTLFVCNRFDDTVSFFDLKSQKEIRRVSVPREPFSAAITHDGQHLLVAHHIHSGPADVDVVASSVSVIESKTGKLLKQIPLPNGSTLLRDIRVSPCGRYAVVAHILARFHLPTTQVERGWVNSNAATIIDLNDFTRLNTVLLDNIDSGAATPWAVSWDKDGKRLLITHAGTHELSIIDFPALLAKLARFPTTLQPGQPVDYTAASRVASDIPNDLSFLVGIRQRVKLSGKGPRALAVSGNRAWTAQYFSDSLNATDLASSRPHVQCIPLGPPPQMTSARLGENLFNDATLCFQGWQACSSCHSHDARVDGLNWDNLNDGIGNPKNAKSLLLAFATPPSMWLGVRSNSAVAVRAGIRNSLFTVQPPEVANAIDDYFAALKPMPSPRLLKGKLSPAAERGKRLFFNESVGCSDCHKGAHYTDRKFHDVGTIGKFDQPSDRFDTPSLIEVWRSGPYLHDGRAATLRDVLTTFQNQDKHGQTSHLSQQQLNDLVEFVLSL